jgi:hypothetical protein
MGTFSLSRLRKNYFTYSNWKIVGIIDSDGTFGFKITKRKGGKIGFGLITAIRQKTANQEFLAHLRTQLGVKAQLRRRITGTLKSGQPKESTVLDIAWTTQAGQKLLKILKKCKPRCSGKLRDYLIGLKFLEALQNKYIRKSIQSKQWSVKVKENVTAVAAILLWFQTSNQVNPLSKTRKKGSTPQTWFDYLKPSQFELEEGQKLFETMLKEIESKVQAHEKYLQSGKARLPLDYICGFYVGDGCISISFNAQTMRGEKNKTFTMAKEKTPKAKINVFKLHRRFWFIDRKSNKRYKRILRFNGARMRLKYTTYFSLTGDSSTFSLFQAVASTLGAGQVSAKANKNTSVYRIRSWGEMKRIVFPLLDTVDLPSFRQRQFQKFKTALTYFQGQAYRDRKNTRKLITLLHDMNSGGMYRRKKKGSLIRGLRKFFKQKDK